MAEKLIQVGGLVSAMAAAALGAVIIKEFVVAANLTGSAGIILGLFTFILVSAVALRVLKVI